MKKLVLFLIASVSFLSISLILGNAVSAEVPLVTPEMMPDVMKGYEGAFLKMVLTFIALIVGIFFTVWFLKRLSRGQFSAMNANRTIKIVEKRALSPKTLLYLVEIGEKRTLIAESQLEVKSLITFDALNGEESVKDLTN